MSRKKQKPAPLQVNKQMYVTIQQYQQLKESLVQKLQDIIQLRQQNILLQKSCSNQPTFTDAFIPITHVPGIIISAN